LERKKTHFVLWLPGGPSPTTPQLVIGTLQGKGSAATLAGERAIPLRRSTAPGADGGDVWEIPAVECGLESGHVYHYWFLVKDTNAYRADGQRALIRCTDPAATSVDWRLLAPAPPGYGEDERQPAAVVRFADGKLVPADPDTAHGHAHPLETFDVKADVAMVSLPPNNRLVIYELPTAWTRAGAAVNAESVGVGTFRDVLSMLDRQAPRGSFAAVAALRLGRAHILDLGVNAVELLPPADSFQDRSRWGYGTSNYFAPDFDLGRPLGQDAPTACADLLAVSRACHKNGIRLFVDMVMAFAQRAAYHWVDYLEYFVRYGADPRDPEQSDRDGFGGDLWKYGWSRPGYDPLTGDATTVFPARQFHLQHLRHWMTFFHVDGLRLDSVNNVRSYDFVGAFRDEARSIWRERWTAEGGGQGPAGADERFLVVGEELSVPPALLDRIDGLWNEHFRRRVRNALIGRNAAEQPSFEWTVREMIDCRLLGFRDGTQAVNYLGSHDVTNTDGDGVNNDRMFNFLDRFGVVNKEERIKLGFVCLLTAVGVPMIFAGDEFADAMDFDPQSARRDDAKQSDPLNLDRMEDPWRQRLFQYVSRLCRLRTTHDALSVNDTDFLHSDFADGKRVMVWRRGRPGDAPVVVVANFSDFATDETRPDAEYRIPNFPATPAGRRWREVTQDRVVPAEWIGREPIFPWEAKVYVLE
jgi:1,4-alpha-glucan branching enzyme